MIPAAGEKIRPPRVVYISYAWDDPEDTRSSWEEDDPGDARSSREEIVNQIEDSLLRHGYDVRREKTKLGYGKLISAFMKEMGSGGCVIVVLSDKYLHSHFCMYELLEVHRNHHFHDRVCPVVLADAVGLRDDMYRLGCSKYWADKFKEYAKEYGRLNRHFLSPQEVERYSSYREICHEVGKLLGFIADMRHIPLDELRKDDFATLRGRINECLMQHMH